MTAPTTEDLQTAAVRGSLWTSLHATVALPLAVLGNIVVARFLGPIQFGYLATLIAAYGIITSLANVGISDATIQWGASAFAHGDNDRISGLVRRCAGYHLFVETPLVVVATALLLWHSSWQTQLAACTAVGIGMAIGTGSVVQTMLSRTATIARVALVTNLALQVAVVAAAASAHSGFVVWAARVVVLNVMPVVLLLKLPRELRSAVLHPLLPIGWPSGFVRYAAGAAVAGVVSLLVFSRTEIFVLQAKHLTLAAGIYALAFGIAAQLTAPVDSLLGPMLPAAASLAAAAPDRLAGAVLRGLRFTALGAAGIAAVGVPAATVLAGPIYGSRFPGIASLLLPLALLSCLQSVNHPITAFLYGMRRIGAMLAVNAVAFAVDIGLAFALVGSWGAWGAVVANAAGQTISLVGGVLVLGRRLSLPAPPLARSLRTFVEGSAAAALGCLATHVDAPIGVRLALGVAIGGIAFFLAQRFGRRVLTHDDVLVLENGLPDRLRGRTERTLGLLGVAG